MSIWDDSNEICVEDVGLWGDLVDASASDEKKSKRKDPRPESPEARAMKNRERHITRRAMSEQAMNEILDWHFEDGMTYHIMSGGDVDSLTFLRGVVKQQKLKYCLLSTWCMSMTDAEEIGRWIDDGLVERMDFYVGEIFQSSYMDVFEYIQTEIAPKCGGRICIARNHSKVMAGFGEKFDFSICSSANVNTNPRIENTTITIDTGVAKFYKMFFDSLKPYNKGFESWTPWEVNDGE